MSLSYTQVVQTESLVAVWQAQDDRRPGRRRQGRARGEGVRKAGESFSARHELKGKS